MHAHFPISAQQEVHKVLKIMEALGAGVAKAKQSELAKEAMLDGLAGAQRQLQELTNQEQQIMQKVSMAQQRHARLLQKQVFLL